MAQNKNTTNVAIYLDVNEQLQALCDETKLNKLEVASQLLRFALGQSKIELTEKTITVIPKKKSPPKK